MRETLLDVHRYQQENGKTCWCETVMLCRVHIVDVVLTRWTLTIFSKQLHNTDTGG